MLQRGYLNLQYFTHRKISAEICSGTGVTLPTRLLNFWKQVVLYEEWFKRKTPSLAHD